MYFYQHANRYRLVCCQHRVERSDKKNLKKKKLEGQRTLYSNSFFTDAVISQSSKEHFFPVKFILIPSLSIKHMAEI